MALNRASSTATSNAPERPLAWMLLFAALLATRLCHVGLLWIEEAYPLTGALELWHGRVIYRDFWFDKPPGAAFFYLLSGLSDGWLLRLLGAAYLTLCAWLAARVGGLFGAGWPAALLLSFFCCFDFPAATLALSPDHLLIAPQLAAVYYALQRKPWHCGLACALALLVHAKGLVLLAVCLLLLPDLRVAVMTLLPQLLLAPVWSDYVKQVWVWGQVYQSNPFTDQPLRLAATRIGSWCFFHASLALACWGKAADWKLLAWPALFCLSTFAGWRFFPRYFFVLLPSLCIFAAVGWVRAPGWARKAALVLLLIPLFRFGPTFVRALNDPAWSDVALHQQSRAIAGWINAKKQAGDTLFVYGYRPDINVMTQLPGAWKAIESQPLTGVFADRHLQMRNWPRMSVPATRAELLSPRRPAWMVDCLSGFNPALADPALFVGYAEQTRLHGCSIWRLPLQAEVPDKDAGSFAKVTQP
jgi:hypothetical protein